MITNNEQKALTVLFDCIERYGMEKDITDTVNSSSGDIIERVCDAAWDWDVFPSELISDS
jgi:hypothetical protein